MNTGSGVLATALEHVASRLLGALDVGLVERVDPDEPSGDDGGVLPQQHLRAERRVDGHAPAGGRQRVHVYAGADRDQHLVTRAGGEVRRVQGRYDDRQDALAVLARRLGDQLLRPVTEARDAGVLVAEDDLVDPVLLATPSSPPSRSPGLSASSDSSRGWIDVGLVEQPADVGTGEPARHQPERGQRRVATTDVGVGVEDAVARLGGGLVERRAGVGHDDDVRRRLEVGVLERLLVGALLAVGLDRAARLAGDDHDGALERSARALRT